MRTTEEIGDDICRRDNLQLATIASILEVLLDIRDILAGLRPKQ